MASKKLYEEPGFISGEKFEKEEFLGMIEAMGFKYDE
jgi:hypothetical protein